MEEQKKKRVRTETVFQDIPKLKGYFESIEYEIRNYGRYRWDKTVTKEKLRVKKQEMLSVAQNLDNIDLRIAYYLRNLHGVSRMRFLHMLEDMYGKQCEFRNSFYNTNEYTDPLNIGCILYGRIDE